MLNPPKISKNAQKAPRENRALPIEQKRSPMKIEDLTADLPYRGEGTEAEAIVKDKMDTRVTIENENESKVQLLKQDLTVNLVSNAV